jgi:signal peptidase II
MTAQRSFGLARGTRGMLLLAISAVTVSLDQLSKIYAISHWKGQPPQVFFGDLFRIQYAENDGAFLSLLANMPDAVRFWVLTVINGLVLAGMAGYLLAGRHLNFRTFLPLALIVAGGIGNLIDRIRFNFVVDFFNLGIGNLRTGIFNVADMAITAGFLLMLPLVFWSQTEEDTAETLACPADAAFREEQRSA